MKRDALGLEQAQRAATWAGWKLSDSQLEGLHTYAGWLRREAIPGGALGPNEAERLPSRHLADSLLFAAGWPGTEPPARAADLGTGAGLPGVPLAILWPSTRVHLVERSGRRADLVARAVRIMGLENVEVHAVPAEQADLEVEMVVARAAAPLVQVRSWARKILLPGGIMVVGGSWVEAPTPEPDEEVREVPLQVLDRPVWLRIMAAP